MNFSDPEEIEINEVDQFENNTHNEKNIYLNNSNSQSPENDTGYNNNNVIDYDYDYYNNNINFKINKEKSNNVMINQDDHFFKK
jgi:hypothetical protein